MKTKSTLWAQVDEQGRLVLPQEVTTRFGLKPGAQARIVEDTNEIRLHRPVSHLAKVYVEPTNQCNLTCRICIRNVWDEPPGRMARATFERILEGLRDFSPTPTLFFGGLGEPLFHPGTIQMVAHAKQSGARVEMITNGTLLTEKKSRQLIEAGLDLLWVTIAGATPEAYADVRLGAALPKVLANLSGLYKMRPGGHHPWPEIGIAFVAMKRNIDELPAVLKIGRKVGATHFSVSNVLPYTEEMQAEILYNRLLHNITYLPSPWLPRLNLPKINIDDLTGEAFIQALNSGYNVTITGNNLGDTNDVCQFIESGSMAIGWDGNASPCLPLLHTHTSFLHGKEHVSRRYVIGNVNERELSDIWNDQEYVSYRNRVQQFAFSPCSFCGGCDLSEANEEDCVGNIFPACGGCLWAQGLIQCP